MPTCDCQCRRNAPVSDAALVSRIDVKNGEQSSMFLILGAQAISAKEQCRMASRSKRSKRFCFTGSWLKEGLRGRYKSWISLPLLSASIKQSRRLSDYEVNPLRSNIYARRENLVEVVSETKRCCREKEWVVGEGQVIKQKLEDDFVIKSL
jgi:hypothetical protein